MAISNFLIFSVFFVLLAVVFVTQCIKVVPQQNAWVVERLGKFHSVLTPGLNIIIPFIDRVAYKHSLKEVPLDTPSQVCITKDNTQLTVDGVLFFQSRPKGPYRHLVADVSGNDPHRRFYPLAKSFQAFGTPAVYPYFIDAAPIKICRQFPS